MALKLKIVEKQSQNKRKAEGENGTKTGDFMKTVPR